MMTGRVGRSMIDRVEFYVITYLSAMWVLLSLPVTTAPTDPWSHRGHDSAPRRSAACSGECCHVVRR